MNRLFVLLILGTVVLSSCSYAVRPVSAPAVNIYSSYDEKIPGTFVVVIDDSVTHISREIKPSGRICSAYKYPISVGDSMALSVMGTLRSVFENIIEQSTLPTSEDLIKMDARGSILIKMERFDSKVRCSQGFMSASCTATSDIEFGVRVRGVNRKLFATSVGDSATVDGDAGGACEDIANLLSESISKSVKEALERLGERLSNSSRLREKST